MAKKTGKAKSRAQRPTTRRKPQVVRLRPAQPRESRRHQYPIERPASVQPIRIRNGDDITIVGVGASAGGLEAFSSMIRALPPKPGFAMVLVQHLAPQHESALPTLLASYTAMPVVQVTEGMRIERDHVYVIPPNVQMGITDGHFHLKPRPEDRSQYTPIDSFLTSLADHAKRRAIGVILSGTASDGAIGVREIKGAGGITFAQTPKTAKYDSMPRAAIATGMIDIVLPPAEIAAKLTELAEHPYVREFVPTSGDELNVRDEQLRRIFDLLRPASGIDFKHYKLPDHQAAAAPANGLASADRRSALRSATRAEPRRSPVAVPGPADPCDSLFSRAGVVQGACRAGVSETGRGSIATMNSRFAPGSPAARPERKPIRWRSRCSSTCTISIRRSASRSSPRMSATRRSNTHGAGSILRASSRTFRRKSCAGSSRRSMAATGSARTSAICASSHVRI